MLPHENDRAAKLFHRPTKTLDNKMKIANMKTKGRRMQIMCTYSSPCDTRIRCSLCLACHLYIIVDLLLVNCFWARNEIWWFAYQNLHIGRRTGGTMNVVWGAFISSLIIMRHLDFR